MREEDKLKVKRILRTGSSAEISEALTNYLRKYIIREDGRTNDIKHLNKPLVPDLSGGLFSDNN